MNENEPEVKTFKECPNCGSAERQVADLARKEGLENPEMYGLNCRPSPGPDGKMVPRITAPPIFMGPVIDQKAMMTAIIGHKFPIFAAPVDACGKCGTIYTIEQQVHVGQKMGEAPMRMGFNRGAGPRPGEPGFEGPLFPGPY